MSPRTETMRTVAKGYQVISCLNCGSVWRIERYTEECYIEAELLICPLCIEKIPKEDVKA